VPTDKRQRQKQGQQARREAALAAARKQQRKRRMVLTAGFAVVVIALIGALSLTGGDDKDSKVSSGEGTTTTTEAKTTPTSAPPEAPEPGGDTPVTELGIEDLKVGTGKTVKKGDTIVAHYYGATYKDGKKFQASWDNGSTFETVIGEGKVIQGWDEGIPGMKVGGRRKLTIPAAMAYGADDPGDGSPFGDLVFIVDVYAIK
jgi:peptidylprolyl isomerase